MNDIAYIDYNDDVDKCLNSIQDELKKSEFVYVRASEEKLQGRVLDLPEKMRLFLGKNPRVKLEFGGQIDGQVGKEMGVDDVEFHSGKRDETEKAGEKKNSLDTPCVTVCILTHNRTNVVCAVIDYLVKNLKYDNLKWCISDDRSTDKNHVETLVQRFLINGIRDVKVLRTDDEHYGLGASMNNALKYAWTNGPIALTMEDDWILQKELDLSQYVRTLERDSDLGMIRLCHLDIRNQTKQYDDNFYSVGKAVNWNKHYIFNNQCGLRHRRVYDFLGYNKENCHCDKQEEDIRDRYNKMTNFGEKYKVLWPKCLRKDVLDDPSLYFIHVGKSTCGHGFYKVPQRFNWIYEDKWNEEVNRMVEDDVFFRIIIPTFNLSKYIERCLESIAKQTFKSFKVVVVDDNSLDGDETYAICKKYDFVDYVQLKEHVDAGGCRNVGMQYYRTSRYTLFCDGDDYYMKNDAFEKLHDFIVENNYPECVSFQFYWEEKEQTRDAADIESPWCRCIKTNLVKQFKSNRRKQNDVIWYLRQFDSINENKILNECLYFYTSDNPLSCSHRRKEFKYDNRVIASQFYLLADLLEEKFQKKETRENASRIFKLVLNKRIKNIYLVETLQNIIKNDEQNKPQ